MYIYMYTYTMYRKKFRCLYSKILTVVILVVGLWMV